jgi:hypothetical protein
MTGRPLVDREVAVRRLAGPSHRDAAAHGGDRSACEIELLSTAAERAGSCNRIHTYDIETVGGSVHAAARRS